MIDATITIDEVTISQLPFNEAPSTVFAGLGLLVEEAMITLRSADTLRALLVGLLRKPLGQEQRACA